MPRNCMNYQILKNNKLLTISEFEYLRLKQEDEDLYGGGIIHLNECGNTLTLIPFHRCRQLVIKQPLSLSHSSIDEQSIANYKREMMLNDMANNFTPENDPNQFP